jgi:salicylate hydroxylase
MIPDTIMIIGGGMGGLCLAQGLHRAGLPFTVFEREAASGVGPQDACVRIDAAGQEALARCLPVDLLYLLYQTAAQADAEPWHIDSRAIPIRASAPGSGAAGGDGLPDLCVHRGTLTEILRCGIDRHVRYDHRLTGFVEHDEAVVARFANGVEARGTLLIGADGIDSAVRRQLASGRDPEGTGMTCITGRTPATPAHCRKIGKDLCAGSSVVFAGGVTALIDVMAFREPMAMLAARIAPDCRLSPVADYFHWTLTGPSDVLGGPGEIVDHVWRLVRGWAPALQAVVLNGDPAAWTISPVRSLEPVPAFASKRVALLGDAAHVASPADGLGASLALQDAADLVAQIVRAKKGSDIAAAIPPYDAIMRERGIDAVRASLAGGPRLAAEMVA